MRIRGAVPEDGLAIARVQVTSWRETYTGIVPQEYLNLLGVEERGARWRERVLDVANVILVAEDDVGVFGFAAGGATIHPVEGYDGELIGLYLLRSHHREGAGRALVRAFAGRLAPRGFQSMVVWALKENPACGFYERMGGVRVAEKTIEVGGAQLPEVAFGWKDIRKLCRADDLRPILKASTFLK